MKHFRSRLWRWAFMLVVTGAAAGIADASSVGPVAACAVTIGALAFAYGVTVTPALYQAWRHPNRRHHWCSQVFQGDLMNRTVEFDLWSECDHEIDALYAEVIDPDGAAYRSEATITTPHGRINATASQGIGTYPDKFPGGKPLVKGGHYQVVWYGRRTSESGWVEIARQAFTTPLDSGRVRQGRE